MYHFSIGKFDDPIQIIFVIILFILNLFIIKITYKNFTLLFQTKKNEFILIKSVFILFLLLTILLFLNQAFWSIIKLFFYISFFWFILITTKFSGKKLFSINYVSLFLIAVFPFYFFFLELSMVLVEKIHFPQL